MTHYCNKRPCMVLLLNGVASHDLSPPRAGFLQGTTCGKADHPCMAAIVGLGGPFTAMQFAGDGPGGDQL